jgi:hypothetical protein
MIDKDFIYYLIFSGIGLIYLIIYLIYKKKHKDFPTEKLETTFSIKNQITEIECPFCHNKINPFTKQKVSTGGVIMIIVGLIFTPVLIGIVFIIIGISMKVYEKYCPKCNMKLQ